MARADLKGKPEWKHQEELRAQRRKGKTQMGRAVKKKPLPVDTNTTLRLVILDRSPENLQECYLRLKDPTITTYFRKYRHHGPRQQAVMRGEVIFEDLPPQIYAGVLKKMTAGGAWKQGKLLLEADLTAAEQRVVSSLGGNGAQ